MLRPLECYDHSNLTTTRILRPLECYDHSNVTKNFTRASRSTTGTGSYDSDNDGAGHPVFANFATQLEQLEQARDLASSFYDPFRGRGAIPTKSSLGDYYATGESDMTFDQCTLDSEDESG